MNAQPFSLFRRFGVELEYMIVQGRTLNVQPIADQLIRLEVGRQASDVTRGKLEWSNELALHVIELKTGRPAPRLAGLAKHFQSEVRYLNERLAEWGARLLPTAMHPWMNPDRESRLWPHDNQEIYATFDRIFGCRGHGWTNLQSVHLNLPFSGPDEFVRLHTAIRLLLPLLPALAASSPFLDGGRGPCLDNRLDVYRRNCARIPSVTAGIVPEAIGSPDAYRRRILNRIQKDIRPFDPEGVLDPEWTNARGAIARFCRNTIEIRVLDVQECPAADLAILEFVVAVLKTLVSAPSTQLQAQVPTGELQSCLRRVARSGSRARVTSPTMLRALGFPHQPPISTREILQDWLARVAPRSADWTSIIRRILDKGPLAERIVRAVGDRPSRRNLGSVYRQLAECLQAGELYRA